MSDFQLSLLNFQSLQVLNHPLTSSPVVLFELFKLVVKDFLTLNLGFTHALAWLELPLRFSLQSHLLKQLFLFDSLGFEIR